MNDEKGNNQEMKNLDSIEKKNIFKTPEGYFEQLPDRIQARISEQEKPRQIWMSTGFRLAAAAAVVLLIAYIGVLRMDSKETVDYDDLLAEVTTVELVAYIESTDMTTDEILDEINLDEQTFEQVFEDEQNLLDEIYQEEDILLEIDEFI